MGNTKIKAQLEKDSETKGQAGQESRKEIIMSLKSNSELKRKGVVSACDSRITDQERSKEKLSKKTVPDRECRRQG